MRTEDLTLVETSGDPATCAGQLGEAVRDNFRAIAGLFEPNRRRLETPAGKRVAERVRVRFFRECEDLLPCLDAFAGGAGVTRDEILRVNMTVVLAKSAPLADGCTGFVLRKGDRVVLGQNWDTGETSAPMAALEVSRYPDGTGAVRFTSCLFLDFWAGVNPHGVATGGCSGPAGDPIGTGDGLGVMFWRMPTFYRCRSVSDIRGQAERVPLVGKGTNTVYADRDGEILWTQLGGGRRGVCAPKTPYCAATGYRPLIGEAVTEKEVAERNRWLRVMGLGADASVGGRDPVADVKAILCDHCVVDGHPDSSPCRRDGPENATQYSLVLDLLERRLYYCGQPDDRRWRTVDFGA